MEKNLEQQEALKKFRKLVNEINVCMFITNNADGSSGFDHTRPMYTIEVEENGALWFFTDIRSIKVEEISKDQAAHLVYAHPGKESFLDVWGKASIITDKQEIKDKWTLMVKAWFPGGIDDPNISLLKVQPTHAYYWDAEAGRMISFLKIIAGAITGNKSVSSDAQGALKI
jgi:general stress protein 26